MGDSSATRLRLGLFTNSLVERIGRDEGIFADHGLVIETAAVESSPSQFKSLWAADHDLILTSPDNVVSYRFVPENPLKTQMDVRIIGAVDRGLGLSVMSASHIEQISDLRGARIGVDVANSGFAFALYAILEASGLQKDDYEVVALGATPRRTVALLDGSCEATLLNAGHDLVAELAGCRRLARVSDHIDPYLGTVIAATGPWLQAHADEATRFLSAWHQATAAALGVASARGADDTLADVFKLPSDAVGPIAEVIVSSKEGLVVDGIVDQSALEAVIGLRVRYGQGSSELSATAASDTEFLDSRFAAGVAW